MSAPRADLDRQAVTPFIACQDGVAAMDWLIRAFGFTERARWLNDDGTLAHGELVAGGGLIMLAGGIPGYEGPRRHRAHCAAAATWSQTPWVIDGVMVRVDDVDAHHARAVQAGAHVLSEPEDQPYGRSYRVEDLEGHRWMFQRPVPVA
jgi:uncharacterized glyoxalase superfamily protein PhnB